MAAIPSTHHQFLPPTSASPRDLPFRQSYAELPTLFWQPWTAAPSPNPSWAVFNRALAHELHFDDFPQSLELLSGKYVPAHCLPIVQAYAGHQYGHFTGLGDGRTLLLGELPHTDGRWLDLQLKGSGATPYSRNGDGKAALGPMLREYVISEFLHAMRVPTTRSLAVTLTGERIQRPLGEQPGAILTRVAASHLRVGTFEWAAAHQQPEAILALVHFAHARHQWPISDPANPAASLLEAVVDRQARLIAQWMNLGFVHGVMNTDNMAISGEAIDFGPCAFLDAYIPHTAFSSIDRHGRYAYDQQPAIAQWNLARFAEALLPLLHPSPNLAIDLANAAIDRFMSLYQSYWLTGMRAKLGLLTPTADDESWIRSLLDWMALHAIDFSSWFAQLSHESAILHPTHPDLAFASWHQSWRERLAHAGVSPAAATATMRLHNPCVIPRNHLVEEALTAATLGTLQPFLLLLDHLSNPTDYSLPRPPELSHPTLPTTPYVTYCGT